MNQHQTQFDFFKHNPKQIVVKKPFFDFDRRLIPGLFCWGLAISLITLFTPEGKLRHAPAEIKSVQVTIHFELRPYDENSEKIGTLMKDLKMR